MDGYVENISKQFKYAFKRHIPPNGKIMLDDLYKVYGVKHGLEGGLEFAEWVRGIKLPDPSDWNVVFEGVNILHENKESGRVTLEGQIIQVSDEPINLPKPSKQPRRPNAATRSSSPIARVKEPMTDEDILNMKIDRDLKKKIENIKDPKIIKYALNRARYMPGKALLIKVLKDRLNELNLR